VYVGIYVSSVKSTVTVQLATYSQLLYCISTGSLELKEIYT